MEIVSDDDRKEWQKAMSYALRQAPDALGNFAKGTGAGLAGLPVDIVSEILRFGGKGIEVGEKPVMGSRWLRDQMGVPEDSVAATIGEFASPDPLDAARLSQYAPDALQHALEAMTVFHGSPHKWNKVDLSKVGTGEGAQAYGHGFYTAEDLSVGDGYRKTLSGTGVNGAAIQYAMEKGYSRDAAEGALLALASSKGDPEKAIQSLTTKVPEHMRQYINDDLLQEQIKAISDPDIIRQATPGYLYELDLPDETIDKMLDWDKPLSEQPQAIEAFRKAYKEAGIPDPDYYAKQKFGGFENVNGQEAYRTLERSVLGGNTQQVSKLLNKSGIPGIKYLDGTSRSAGDGTRNFVVFDEKHIKPLKRNGEEIIEE